MNARGADHDKYRALYTLGSTMTFNTLIDADRLANLALSMLVEFTGARRGFLVLLDDDGRTRHRFGVEIQDEVRELELSASLEGRLRGLRAGEGAAGSEGGRSLSVPLMAEDSMVGALHLEREESRRAFSAGDRALLEACATHLAQSLRSRRLYETHLAQRRRVELLDRVTRAISSAHDLEEVMGVVVRTAAEALSASSGALILGDTAGRLGVASGHRLRNDPVDPDSRPSESRIVRWVFTEGTPTCDGGRLVTPIRQVLRDKRLFEERRMATHASAFVRTLGVLYLEGPLQRTPFTEEDLMVLGVFADHASTAITNNTLMRQASTDALTHLDSRRQLESRLVEEVEFARRHGVPLSVIMVDIDHFKRINDGHGHPIGDEVLAEVARILKDSVRKFDVCARYGGEEFTVVLPETHLAGALVVAENIRLRVEGSLFSRERIPVTVSLGVAELPLHGSTPEAVLRKADRALYDAKAAGRNCCRTAPGG